MPAALLPLQTTNHVHLKGHLNISFRAQLGPCASKVSEVARCPTDGGGAASLAVVQACFSRQENERQPHYCSGLEKENEAAPMFNSLASLFASV